ncbi:hypothetical protein F5J12DRAFT_898101 [Pisolithus orientalis]|uniref:uncharacterized protein n=1 Tax=Pisolithus orientalis TaxID=936130 RepID=UPI002224EA1C|nr:uncharacterized protein F5J12DRAFT_898101 [Pisolithus orientalis]KAI5988859.1 hypothetical protein F5J12DRAFT_898101 [Pisolithus orientalis]
MPLSSFVSGALRLHTVYSTACPRASLIRSSLLVTIRSVCVLMTLGRRLIQDLFERPRREGSGQSTATVNEEVQKAHQPATESNYRLAPALWEQQAHSSTQNATPNGIKASKDLVNTIAYGVEGKNFTVDWHENIQESMTLPILNSVHVLLQEELGFSSTHSPQLDG